MQLTTRPLICCLIVLFGWSSLPSVYAQTYDSSTANASAHNHGRRSSDLWRLSAFVWTLPRREGSAGDADSVGSGRSYAGI